MTTNALTALITTHGLWLMAPLALIEGPLVTVAAGALAAQGLLSLGGVIVAATIADLCGDALLWLAGRHLRRRLPRKLARRITRRLPLADLRRNAGRVLVFGKLTHSMGAFVLFAAGVARVPFLRFLGFNAAATLPKVTALALLGWSFGTTLAGIGTPLAPALLTVSLAISVFWLRKQGHPNARLVPDPRP